VDTELIRKAYKPDNVRLLLVGESPPAKGGFFYFKDRKVHMTTYTAQALGRAHGITFPNLQEFFKYFQVCGCYLDDLCQFPVDDLQTTDRKALLKASVAGLAQRIREMNPDVIAIVLKRIERHVREAINNSGRIPEVFVLPFPGNSHQTKYVEQLRDIIRANVPKAYQQRTNTGCTLAR
jgi:hypothetical protein